MSTHKLIRAGRERLGLSEESFGKLVGVSRSAVQQWEKEDGTAPSRRRQAQVAAVLGITVAELMSGQEIEQGPAIGGRVPLISDVQAGDYREFVDNVQADYDDAEMVTTTVPVKQYTFALRVNGDSMEPDFTQGSILIVEPELDPMPGDFVIAKNGDDESTFKQLVRDGGEWYLKPLNPRYPIKPLGKSTIIGVVRAVERRYR